MLDTTKLLKKLEEASHELFAPQLREREVAHKVWQSIAYDEAFFSSVHNKKQALLVPKWRGLLGQTKLITPHAGAYSVLAVDGSQIYYDKHQGPPCYLINVGGIQLSYQMPGPKVTFFSEPFIFVHQDKGQEDVNAKREELELSFGLAKADLMQQSAGTNPALYLFDGSLIYFHLDLTDERAQETVHLYVSYLERIAAQKILMAGYVSFPKSKELANLVVIAAQQSKQYDKQVVALLEQLTDTDIAQLYLPKFHRSQLFESIAPVTYLYTPATKPYFCFLHVGQEIARIELPAWIAADELLVDKVCALILDQALKGYGYPVALFEAHEQAVVKAADKDLFYAMLAKMSQHRNIAYSISSKQLKKQNPLL